MKTNKAFGLDKISARLSKDSVDVITPSLTNLQINIVSYLRNISKTSASVSSGFPNTRKLMKARGRRPSAFIVFECLETPMKHEARVFEIASQTCIMNQEQ